MFTHIIALKSVASSPLDHLQVIRDAIMKGAHTFEAPGHFNKPITDGLAVWISSLSHLLFQSGPMISS